MSPALSVEPVPGLPEIEPGARLGELIAEAAEGLGEGDVVAISQKAVSKAEGRVRRLAGVAPGDEAEQLAQGLGKDPRLVQLVLEESVKVLRAERGVLIAETRHGFVCANAGIDTSNLAEPDSACLLPEDPDASARRIRGEISGALEGSPVLAVAIGDSFGRAWRLGQAEVAIGCAGLAPLDDWRGRADAAGRELTATRIAVADEAVAAADLARDKTSRTPAVVVRGLDRRLLTREDGPGAAALLRPPEEDLFR
jgi:coenzyme F420-0:L-glutamate ligase/coenzyme F420-1:gamma-L-glutamate ligase